MQTNIEAIVNTLAKEFPNIIEPAIQLGGGKAVLICTFLRPTTKMRIRLRVRRRANALLREQPSIRGVELKFKLNQLRYEFSVTPEQAAA